MPNIYNQWKFNYVSEFYNKILYILSEDSFKTFISIDSHDTLITNYLQIESVGFNLYVYGAILLFICSIILLLAMFSAIIISAYYDSNN